MKLFHSHSSPFVRKVMVVAHELGLAERLELLPSAVHPVKRDRSVLAQHPLAQVPTLVLDNGEGLADSRVICEYLDAEAGGRLFPAGGDARWRALNEQSTADGVLDAALLIRYELTARPESERSAAWIEGQTAKIESALAWFEEQAEAVRDRVDIGTIALACALGYLDLRFSDIAWRDDAPRLAAWFARFEERPAMVATRPPAG
ncbi:MULTISPECIES: glutathione S-transferase [Methylorubrum]|uniref:glutathione S-transferase n=1 Tax=Methylorubrum TaxID=2282523 RepID=UPI0020A1F69C|nr:MULTISPECIES: glutathione S-transferase [Methylorubrum]MCP1549301.1 glutathione S-transferase [Methylorubrum zatmanii]MCP1554086.1 glutathione S-transferase [Methylorubrum extorquens]MCP1579603.1 glutathione S-transferase [Methylorubrum extorquens]